MKKLHIFTLVFGGQYLAYWKRAGAVSLLWPENLRALNSVDALWDIYTDAQTESEVRALELPFRKEVTVVDPSKDDALKAALAKAFKESAYFMPAPPDLIWGNGIVIKESCPTTSRTETP